MKAAFGTCLVPVLVWTEAVLLASLNHYALFVRRALETLDTLRD